MHHKPLLRRGERIRTSDLLNPIQEPQQPNSLPDKPLTSNPQTACTPACTGEAKSEQTDPVAAIADALAALTPADRARLAALLARQEGKQD